MENCMVRKQWILATLGLLMSLVPASAFAYEARVSHVFDGDSFVVRASGSSRNIRLYGIDCPEHYQAGGDEARQAAKRLIEGQWVDIQPMYRDPYGRTVAIVHVGGTLLNAELVRTGQAWVYGHFCQSQPLCREMKSLEREAKMQRVGIWSEPHPVPPWVWKHRRHPN